MKNKTARNLVLILLSLIAIGSCTAAYKLYEGLYDQILEPQDIFHLNVEELRGTHPTILHISMEPLSSAAVLRTITTRKKGQTLILLAHSGISGFVKPNSNWGRNFEFTIPDSVNEVRFGHSKTLIWKRGATLSPLERH